MDNTQKWALITGASEGIGYELAKLFAKDGYNLVAVAQQQQKLQQVASELKQEFGIEVVPMAKDLFKREAPQEIYNELKTKGLQIDVLVNNAGQGQYGEFVDNDIARELDIVQLNIGAYLALTKFYLKEMLARNEGKILQVSSIAGEVPGPLHAVYHGTKAFVTTFTEAVQEEIKDSKVTLTYLMPGATDTDFFNKADMEHTKMVQEGDLADPAKVAEDGYKALMKGDRHVTSGFMNKLMVAGSKVLPDRLSAKGMHKQMQPSDKTDKDKS
jgi:uncharacterized protein